jgi:parallel beta-helix repeat protein
MVGILLSGVTDVQIANNTIFSETGDNIRLEDMAREIEVRNNILWVESGTNIDIATNSRSGFFSDYNQLHATGTGTLVHWMRDFTDVLDWQVDVNRFDLHSMGTTVVNPLGAEPAFFSMARDDYQLWGLVGGLQQTNPSVDRADPRVDVGVPVAFTNRLVNPSFESGTTGWTTNVQATSGSPNGPAFDGTNYFVPGSVATGVAEQSVDLLNIGYTPTQLDSQNLVAVFGGRVRSKSESLVDTASIRLEFRNGSGVLLGQQTASATNSTSRWELVGERLAVPVGTRQVTYRFESIRNTGTTSDAYLDHAFLRIYSEALSPDFGAYGHIDNELPISGPHLALVYPDLYVDWQRDAARTIRWRSHDNSINSPVRIDLLQDGTHGPQFVTTIVGSTPDDGEFIWIPGNSGVNFDTPGLRIQVSYVADPSILDRSNEAFAVPDNSLTYFVDDASNGDDEYTPGAIGSNRNTGKRADAPKPHPVNLLRAYDLPAGAVVSIDTGAYPLFDAIRLSGTTDLGLGTEEGFTLRGPTDPAKDVTISWIYPDAFPQALLELSDADFMTLSNLELIGSQRGLWVTGGSDNFSASSITARNQSLDAIDITPNNSAAHFAGLVAENAGRYGIVVTGPFASLSDGRVTNSLEAGIKLTGSGNARIEAMVSTGNRVGLDVSNSTSGTRTVVGHTDLSLGRGNQIANNTVSGIVANQRVQVVGNVVHGHRGSISGTGISLAGTAGVAEAARNVVFDNWNGIVTTSGSAGVLENRVYGNLNLGIHAANSDVSSNVIYNNPTGLLLTASQGLVSNNLVYNASTGVRVAGGGPDLVNNTVYQDSGNAVRVEGGASSVVLRNNIVWTVGGTAISIANDSQSGLASDYNLLYATGSGVVGNWLGAVQPSLQQWQIATGRDINSLSNDPLFVDIDGADNVLGYVLGGTSGSDDDFHLQSPFGSRHGGSLAPVVNAVTGLPVLPAGTLTNDAALSPAIDRGAPTDTFAAEPSPNGGYVNLGAHGNTAQASLSPAQLLLLEDPNGGEIVAQGSTFPIRWRANGFVGNVTLEVSSTGHAGTYQALAGNEANDGSYDWFVDAGTYPASTNYSLRIRSIDQPAVVDISDAPFEVAAPTNAFYVNDGSTAGDEYSTAAGNSANTGLSPASPLASIQAVLNAYDLGPGDVIYVDTGTYAITTNIAIGAGDSGVRIQGPVQPGSQATLNRGSTASGNYVFSLSDATDVTLDSLEIIGGNRGVFANLASHDLTVTNSIVRNHAGYGIHIATSALRAEIAQNEIYSNNLAGIFVEGDDAEIHNNVIRNNSFSSARGIEITTNAANTRIRENTIHNNVIGILASQASAPSGLLIHDNLIHGNLNAGVNVNGGGRVESNELYGNTGGVGGQGISLSGAFAEAIDNVSRNNSVGINVTNGAIARENLVHSNSVYGVQMSIGQVLQNVVHSNAIGMYVGATGNLIANNLVYGNTTVGIDHNWQTSSTILNNTVYQPTGDAIRATTFFSPATAVSSINNILVVGAGSAFNIAPQNQSVFNSDYNLFQVTGTGRVATFSTVFTNWTEWQFATANDRHGLEADPLFEDPDGADDVLGTPDDDFRLQTASPARDSGHPTRPYAGELASGNRVDLGGYGNTLEASTSGGRSIQLIEPATYQKVRLGQTVDVRWISQGLTSTTPVLLMNTGGGSVHDFATGRWSPDLFRGGLGNTGSFTAAVDLSGVTNPPPVSVLQTFANASGSGPLRYAMPLADGDYQVRLFFVDPNSTATGQRRFDVHLQGQTVLSNFDIFADVGAVRKATSKSFTITAQQGQGLRLDLVPRTSSAILNAIEITRVDAAAPESFTVDLEFSPDNGQTWSTIATGLPSNGIGEGHFLWNATETTLGHTGIFRATAVGSGLTNVTHTSARGISVAPSTTTFYVNTAGDTDFTDNEYTTAAGNDLNSGATPDAPLANLQVLLRNYTLTAGDTIYVDSGTYQLSDNIDLTAAHSGLRIQGPQAQGLAAVFNRGNTSSGNYVFHLRDAANVTLDSLELTGAAEAVRVDLASHNLTLSNSVIKNNINGVRILSTASGATLYGNEFFGHNSTSGLINTIDVEGDQVTIENNVIRNNGQAGVYLTSTAQNATVRSNELFANSSFAIWSNPSASGVIEQNVVRDNLGSSSSQAMITVAGASMLVQDNHVFRNNKPGISLTNASAIARRNTVYRNLDGFIGTGTLRDNRIFANTQAGIRITGLNPVISSNAIYANASGIVTAPGAGQTATIINNLLYDQTTVGIDVGTGLSGLRIHNNTIFEPTGTAIRLTPAGATEVRNNLLMTNTGTLLNVSNSAQAGFTSDYNLMQVTGAGRVGLWGADTLSDLAAWHFEVGRDGHSLEGDPQFIDIDGPDNRRGYDLLTSIDYGWDDDFRVSVTSPAVNAGDPLSYYAVEPDSGSRVNLGAFGNTPEATDSAARTIQLNEPGVLRKYEVGQTITLRWNSYGFTPSTPVALVNAGGSAIYDTSLGRWIADSYRTGGTTRSVVGSIDTSGLTNPPPLSVLASYADVFANGANGASLRYDLPLADGDYQVRLFFVEPSGGNVRQFDVRLQGQTVLNNYQILADAGAVRKAVAKSFTVSAVGGQGLSVQIVNDGSAIGWDGIISGIEVTRATPSAPAVATVRLEYSGDDGQTWSTIAANLPVGRFGDGTFNWNAPAETSGYTARFRITGLADGVASAQQVSESFMIANGGSNYYINVSDDLDLLDNEYTTASGDNFRSGKSPDAPMKSLDALVRAYDLNPGDTIYVDNGTYSRLLTNVVFAAEDSGVTVRGPSQPGHAAILTRGTTATGSAILEFTGGVSEILIDSLELHTADQGVSIGDASDIEIRKSFLRNHSNRGIDVGANASNVRILQNQIFENTNRGIEVRGSHVTIEGNVIRNSDRGIDLESPMGSVVVRHNELFGHDVGIETTVNSTGHVIEGNSIHDNITRGVFISGGSAGGVQVVANEVFGHTGTNDVGIFYSVSSGFVLSIRENLIHHNFFGLDSNSVTGTVQNNRIYANSSAGMRLTGTSTLVGNQIFSNATGLLLGGTSTTSSVRNNLIYSNTNIGIDVSGGNYSINGNTIVHPVGSAIRFTGSGTGRVHNNIVQADVGTLISVATGGQASFVSNHNLLYPTSPAAHVGVWGSMTAATLVNWQATTGRDTQSLSADPMFLDIDGADNVLGEQGVPEGNGFDDNFGLRANSPAIDAADGAVATTTDALGRPRKDDPSRPNTGAGAPNFVDIGAFEFQGDSGDLTPPVVSSMQPAGIIGSGSVLGPVTAITVVFSEPIDLLAARSLGLYELRGAGSDDQFDTADDLIVGIELIDATAGDPTVTVHLDESLPTDRYRLTLQGQVGQALIDQAGNALDGDNNGTAGGSFSRIFTVANVLGPLSDNDSTANQVAEDAAVGMPVGITALAADPDTGDTVAYSLDDNAGGRFLIDPTTGVVTVASASGLDSEASLSHDIVIRATSSDGSFSTAAFTIAVTDVDEFDVSVPADVNGVANSVNENAPNGTLVGITVLALDPDATNNAITYALANDAGGRFAVHPVTGVISVANGSGLNAEAALSHDVIVRATSADGSFDTQVFTIQIKDVDEFDVGPIADVDPSENLIGSNEPVGSLVGIEAFASDADATNSSIIYSLIDSAGGLFAIDSISGVVTVNGLLDSGSAISHSIIVMSISADGSFSTRLFTIDVVRIAGAFVYHKGSSFAAGGSNVAAALDLDKSLVREGTAQQTLTYSNVINSSRGINGIVFDIANLPSTTLTAADFVFQMSPQGAFNESQNPPSSWQTAPSPSSVSIVPGSVPSRVVIEWPDNSIAGRWLRLTIKANGNTGLGQPEVYYLGHLRGETTGPAGGVYTVSFADIAPIRSSVGQVVGAASITDIDKNGTVAFADISAMRANIGSQLTNISIPALSGAELQSTPVGHYSGRRKMPPEHRRLIDPKLAPGLQYVVQPPSDEVYMPSIIIISDQITDDSQHSHGFSEQRFDR